MRSFHRDDQQVEMLAYAEQISRNASQITEADIQRLRDGGFTDVSIADIALAAAAILAPDKNCRRPTSTII